MEEYQRLTREQRPPPSDNSSGGFSGPVGLRGRVSQVKNASADQQAVIDLLTAISVADGGKKEVWGAPPLAGPSGQCPRFLAEAIWEFQDFWRSKGVFRNIDGVVDPGGNTYKHMIGLARRGGGGRAIPVDPPNKEAEGLLGTLAGLLRPRPSNLTIGGAVIGITNKASAGMLSFQLLTGTLSIRDSSWPGPPRSLSIKGVGGSWGKSISPSSNLSTLGNQIHVGPGKPQQLGIHELAGKCLLVNAWSGRVGHGTTAIIFNIGPQISLRYLDEGGIHVSGGQLLRDATHSCSGFTIVASSISGTGGSISMIEGLVKVA